MCIVKFSEMETEKMYENYLMVKGLSDAVARNNKSYVKVTLYDGVEMKVVNFFGTTVAKMSENGVTMSAILCIKMKKTSSGYFNLESEHSWCINNNPNIEKENFRRSAPIDVNGAFNWLIRVIREVGDNSNPTIQYKSLASLTEKILMDNRDAFIRSSAAEKMHHNYIGGLLFHTVRMVHSAKELSNVYTNLNKELLICGTALHDIGKITCYDTDEEGMAKVSIIGRLKNHSVEGSRMIHYASSNETYNSEQVALLEHMILSHHGKLEWGAVTTPAIPEAEMLHLIDMMDSRMDMFDQAYEVTEVGKLSSDKVYGLENSFVYKPL